jgi:chromosome segregation ATPase
MTDNQKKEDKTTEDLEVIKEQLDAMKKQLKSKEREIETITKSKEDIEKLAKETAETVKKTEEVAKAKDVEIEKIKKSTSEKDIILNEYKKKERIQPISTWYTKQDEETKKYVDNVIITAQDIDWKVFIAGKEDKKSKEEEGDKKTQEQKDKEAQKKKNDELLNPSKISKTGQEVLDQEQKDKDKEDEPKPLDEIYGAEKGFSVLSRLIHKANAIEQSFNK